MRERFILQTTTERIFPGDDCKVLNKSQHPKDLNVMPDSYRGIAVFDFVERWSRYVRPDTDGLHREASSKTCIFEALAQSGHFP